MVCALVSLSVLSLSSLVAAAGSVWDTSNFLDWFRSELGEARAVKLAFSGKWPSFVSGTFVQTGPARFSFGHTRFTHMLDGYAKTNTISISRDGAMSFTAQFLASAFLNASTEVGHISRGMFVGAVEPNPHWGPSHLMGASDNNYIKARRVGNATHSTHMLLADTMVASCVRGDFVTLDRDVAPLLVRPFDGHSESWNDDLNPAGDVCLLGTMAHAAEDPGTGGLIGSMGCIGRLNYHIVFVLEPVAPTKRRLVAKIPLPLGRPPSYMHTLAATPRFIVLIAEPLFMDMVKVAEGYPLGKGGLYTTLDQTLFQIVDRRDGSVRVVESDGFIYGHLLNSWEEDDDIVMDLTWYAAGNATTLGWMNRWFSDNIHDQGVREAWPRSQVMRFRLRASGTVERSLLFAEEEGRNDFETPKINEEYSGRPYCIAYMLQFHSYPYQLNQSSIESGPMGAVGIAKRNLCTGERTGWYSPNQYPSEVQFVPDPNGREEDAGVLLGIVFDGNTNTSYFQALDARTMTRISRVTLPVKSPFLIHSSFFPTASHQESILI